MDSSNFSARQGKSASAPADAFAGAVNDMTAQGLKADAWGDVGAMGLASIGAGAAARGAVGLYNVIRRNHQKKPKSGPALLPLPFPVEKGANFLAGDMASSKPGIPWYGPAMLGVGLGGLAAGWGGVDKLMESRRKAESDAELEAARGQFHQALLSQYDAPLSSAPKKKEKAAGDDLMEKVGTDLDRLWASCESLLNDHAEKVSFDAANLGGMAAGGYGVYAGLSGLMTGSLVYNALKKRSRQSVLESAIKKRDRRRFMQSPTEIYAVPEPVEAGQGVS